MENKFKRFLALMLAVVMVIGMMPQITIDAKATGTETKTVYLKPDSSIWATDGAWFAAYYWDNSGNNWAKMTDDDGDGYYEAEIPAEYSNIIFTRNDPAKTDLSWDAKWNQTNDLTLEGNNNCFTITGWDNGTGVGAWSHKCVPGAAATCTTPQTCTVCGTELVEASGHTYEGDTTVEKCETCGESNPDYVAPVTYVAKIGETGYVNFAEAMTAANAMTGDVVVDVYGEVEFADGMELNGSYTSITFNGKAAGAKITINQTAGGDYLEAHGKTVAFNDLTLAKANPAWSGNSGHMGNYFSVQGGTVTYNNCTFPNGACTSGGTATYNNCTFKNTSEYGLWVYDDALVTVNGGTIDSTKGIKVYSEDEASVTSTLTVQNATFTENVTAKPAVAVGYAESITLIGNTYNNTTAVVELDSGSDADCEGVTFVAQDAEGNDIASTLTVVDRSNSSAACGVLVDGKIYTTVTEAAKEAESGDTVTLLYDSAETVELPEGVTLKTNGHTAENVTVKQPAVTYVAQIGTKGYETLQAAIDAVQNGETIELLGDVTEELVTIEKASGVAFTIDGKGFNFTGKFDLGIGENITIQNIDFVASAEISPDYFIDGFGQNSNSVLNILNCTFTDTDYSTTAIGTQQPTKVVIDGCTANGVASLLQNQGGYDITVKNTSIEGKRGISLGTVVGATVENVTIKAADDKYGIRLNGEIANNTITIKDCNIQAFIPVVVRKAQVENYEVIFEGTNTMTAKNTDDLWMAIGTSEYETNGTKPTDPTGKVTVTLNDPGLNADGVYGEYVEPPKGSINGGLVNMQNANRTFLTIESYITYANESIVVKVFDANGTLLATSSLVDNDRVILGKENWGGLSTMVGINCADDWWDTVWEADKLRADYVPAKATLYVDGVEMNTASIQMRAAGSETTVNWAEVPGVPGVPVAQIGETKYTSLQDAENAAKDGDTIVLLEDIELDGMVTFFNSASARMVTLDMNGKTITLAANWNSATDKSAFWVCDGLTITGNGTINAAPDGDVWAYTFIVGHRTAGTTNGYVGTLVIENGTFSSDDASVVSVTNGTATINGGKFEAAGDMDLNCIDDMHAAGKASIVVKGGTFVGFNPQNNASEGANTNFCAEGYAALPDLNGNYVVGKKPTATVNNLGATTITEYTVYGGSLSGELPLSFVMQFLADQDEEDMATSPFADWYGDFVITFTGIANDSFTADGCYLAGYYGSFGWVVIPVDGMTIEEGVRYPVMLGVGMGQKYDYICSGVQDFKCALYLTPEILAANPNIQVNLELAVVDNSKGDDAAASALVNNENVYSVTDYTYDAEAFAVKTYVAQIGETKYTDLREALTECKAGETVILLADVDLAGTEWEPVEFKGNFDGQNYTISNLVVNKPGISYVGLFSKTTGTEIKNLTINNAKVTGRLNVGVVAGHPWTTAYTNIKVTGHVEVNGMAYVGGVGGKNAYGNWTDITVDVDSTSYVKATSTENGTAYRTYVGGVIGFIGEGGHTFKNISSNIKVIGDVCDIGGLFGIAHYGNNFENVTFTGSVEAPTGAEEVGGIAGVWHNQKGQTVTFTDVTSTGTVTVGDETTTGSIVGGAYTPANDSSSNSGSLLIDGKEAWLAPAKIGETRYESVAAAFAAAQDGDEVRILEAGTYALTTSGKDITITGAVDGVVFDNIGAKNMGGANVTFNNVTFDYYPNVNYTGLQHSGELVYNNCTINGQVFLYGTSETFNNCTFNQNSADAYNVWTYGAKEVAFNECTFNSAGKSVLIYSEQSDLVNTVSVTKSTFNASSAVEGKAAIEMDSSLTAGINLTIDGETTATGFGTGNVSGNSLWNNKKDNKTDANNDITVVVAGETVLAPVTFVAQNGENKYETLAEAITAATAGDTITLIADITEDVAVNKSLTIDGAGKTYTGTMTVGGGIALTVKNVNFDGANSSPYPIKVNKGNSSIVVEDCTVKDYQYSFLYVRTTTKSVSVKNVTVENCPDYAVYFASGVTDATFENLTVKNSNNGFIINNTADRAFTIKNCKMENVGTAIAESKGTNTITCTALGVNDFGTAAISQYANIAGATIEGTNLYGSVASMVAKAENGQTVTVTADHELVWDGETTIDGLPVIVAVDGKTVTIDLNGKKLTGTSGDENLALYAAFAVDNDGSLTLKDSVGTASVEITGTSTMYSLLMAYEYGANKTTKLIVEGGSYYLENAHDCLIFCGQEVKDIVYIKGGTFELGNVGTGENGKPWIFNVVGAGGGCANITGGTFNADINNQFWSSEAVVDETCYVVNNGNGTWTVKAGAAAYVQTTKLTGPYDYQKNIGYATLEEAFEAAVQYNDPNVTLLQDVALSEMLTIPAGKSIVLNLNGKTITGTDNTSKNFSLIDNRGNLTITGNGTMTLTATVNSGWNRYSAVIANNPGGKLVIENGTIEHLGGTDMAYGIDNLTNGKGTYAETVINDGTIKSTYRAIRQFLNGVEAQNILTINGGTVEGANKSIFFHDPSKNANSGTLTVDEKAKLVGDVYLFVTEGSTEWPVEVSIASAALDGTSTVLTGNVPYGYVVEEANGVWGVREANYVAKIGEVGYETFVEALNAVQNGETITVLDVASEAELGTEIEFTKDIEFTITGTAPKYALPVVTFQNATVNIKDAEILIPELDARLNATINVIDSIVHDAGGNGIVKSYYNGAINISGTSVVHTMQVTTMGYITVSDTAKLNATWQTNVYGNGLITVEDEATFATAALHLTGKDYSGRDNTDAERVGKPATIVVDGANFIVGKVYSDNGADYSYNSSKGINIGTIADKSAVLDIKNGANVTIYMANGETAKIGADGTVNVDASSFTVACRAENGKVTLANNGTIKVSGTSDIAANVTGDGWVYMNCVTLDADTKLYGAKVRFASGTNNIDGSVIDDGFFQVGIGAYNGVDANVDTVNGVVVNVKNAKIGSNGKTYAGWIGTGFYDTDAEKTAAMTDAKYVLNIENSVAEFGYLHVSNDGELNVKGNAAEKAHYNNSDYSFYAGDFIINGTATFDATDVLALYTKVSCDNGTDKPGTLNIVNGTEFEAERHNGAVSGTNFELRKTGVVNVNAAELYIGEYTSIAANAVLNIGGKVTALGTITNNGTINLTALDATLTTPEAPVVKTTIDGYEVVYENGAYVVKEIKLFAFYGTNLSLGNNLDMVFAFSQNAVKDWTGHYVEMVRSYADDTTETITVPYADWITSGSYYTVTYGGFAAKEMCDEIALTVYNADGKAVSETKVDSIRAYAMRMYDKADSDLARTAFVDLLNYGTAAQKQFKYGENDYANALLNDDQKAMASTLQAVEDKRVTNSKFFGTNVIIKSNIIVQMAFAGVTDDMYAVVEFTGHKGNAVSVTIQGSEFDASGSYKVISLENMVIADARSMISVTIYNADGSVYVAVQDSIESYVARNLGKSDLFEAFMIFADTAYAYLHRNDQ